MLVERPTRDFVHILAIRDRWLFGSVLVSLFFTKDGLNLLVKVLTAVAHEENLEGLLDGDATLEVLIVHEERHQVVQLAGLQIAWVRDASLVHSLELLLANETVQVVIDLPNDELNIGTGWAAAQELQSTSDIHSADLVMIILLRRVTAAEEFEHAVQLLLLNRLDFNSLEDLGGTGLQFLHLS